MPIIRHKDVSQKKGYYNKILNRTLVDQAQGARTCTVWEQGIPVGGYIAPHYHNYDEVVTVLSGHVEVVIEEETTIITDRSTLFFPAQTVHALRNVGSDPAEILAFHASGNPKVHYPKGTPHPVEWDL